MLTLYFCEAIILNSENWQLAEEHEIELAFDDVNAKVKCVVTATKEGMARVKFIDMPAGIANKLSYLYMKTVAN